MTKQHTSQTDSPAEMDQLVRALSHDMNANFMVLEHSVAELKRSCGTALADKLTSGFDHVEACLRESKRFLDDLVLLGKSGSIEMEPADVDLAEVLAEVKYEQDALLAGRGIEVRVAPDLPHVWCNRSRVKQVFTNLIRNAARHGCASDEPRITISCDCVKADHQSGCGWGRPEGEPPGRERLADSNPNLPPRNQFAQVRVHDNGPGIDPAYHTDVFLPGRRAPGGAEDGTGMGLAIVKKIIEHYGGRVWIDPAATVGTAIVISLPTESIPSTPTTTRDKGQQITGVSHDEHQAAIRGPHRTKRPAKRRTIK